MCARVCNPMAMSEIAKLRSPAIGRKPITSSISLAKVKRDLFGKVDKQESKNFIERELAAHTEAKSKKWGFDFGTGQPMQNHQQYQWERVPPASAPACFNEMVPIIRGAHVMPSSSTTSEDLLDQRAERENGNIFHRTVLGSPGSGSDSESDCSFNTVRTYPLVLRSETTSSSVTASAAVITFTATAASTRSSSSFPSSAKRATRQQRMTDYLKECKRRSTNSPNASAAKKARLTLASSCSPSASSTSSSSSASVAMPSAQQDHQ